MLLFEAFALLRTEKNSSVSSIISDMLAWMSSSMSLKVLNEIDQSKVSENFEE